MLWPTTPLVIRITNGLILTKLLWGSTLPDEMRIYLPARIFCRSARIFYLSERALITFRDTSKSTKFRTIHSVLTDFVSTVVNTPVNTNQHFYSQPFTGLVLTC